ncbi:MAG: phosphopantothenoylcysteine decarboxylase [Prosthecobacter sp.]|nr:phosphopantothenoylcysteine decarboxylase [Prosthecobacter sp.]
MKILITAGPTREPLDPVRYLTNRSSGKMGYALAQAALEAGHQVTLISGPTALTAPEGVSLIRIETARQMFEAVRDHLASQDVAIFSAAVADYRPAAVAEQKIKKTGDTLTLTLTLEKTEDILGSARSLFGYTGFLVGFAAETQHLLAHAEEKRQRKGCDLLIANDVSQPGIGFDSGENEVTLCLPDAAPIPLPRQTKAALARELLAFISQQATLKTSL